ncbi:uncharacterized protein [Montipora capricornis]|uniref:uncharacterized protein n=1 Tax=Montipora capricornis TaxID=246305 RepID=UPI0035F110E9
MAKRNIEFCLVYCCQLAVFLTLCWVKVDSQSSYFERLKRAVTEARCTANCLTLYGGQNNASENVCESSACQECLHPCDKTFGNETLCIRSCNASNSCRASCTFLTHLKTFASVTKRNGPKEPKSEAALVAKKNLTTIQLKWEPVKNTTGTPVYLIRMRYTWDLRIIRRYIFDHVFTVPRGSLKIKELCVDVPNVGLPGRYKFNGISYDFQILVVTANSSVSYGDPTIGTDLPRPGPVSDITVRNIMYDSNKASGAKLKLSASWSPPTEDERVISNYALVWTTNDQCDGYKSSAIDIKLATTGGPQTNGSIYFNDDIMRCYPTLTVYTLNQCIPSTGTSIYFEYRGCKNTTNYPKEECYKFDPPDAPIEDKQVRNLTYQIVAMNNDYTFHANLTWLPPVYPFKAISNFEVSLRKANALDFSEMGCGTTVETYCIVGPLLPNEFYFVEVFSYFEDEAPRNVDRNITIFTPEVDPALVTVRNLNLTEFKLLPETEMLRLNVTWEKPAFNFSNISSYVISYQINGGLVVSTNTDRTYLPIYGILHGQPIALNVTPQYQHDWVHGTTESIKINAPTPDNDRIKVRNLRTRISVGEKENYTYSLNITWNPPSFRRRLVGHYDLFYEFSGYPDHQVHCFGESMKSPGCRITAIMSTFYQISGILPLEQVKVAVTPVYIDKYIHGEPEGADDIAPAPREALLRVVGLKHDGILPSINGTFRTRVRWQKPLFPHCAVVYYTYTITKKSEELAQVQRRAIDLNTMIRTPQTNGSIYIFDDIMRCYPTLTVYTLNQCIPSKGTSIDFEYRDLVLALREVFLHGGGVVVQVFSHTIVDKAYSAPDVMLVAVVACDLGCKNTTNYPKEECYKFDPPDAPIEDKQVRNLTYQIVAMNNDYTFHANLTWLPPVYPFKAISNFEVSLRKANALDFSEMGCGTTVGTYFILGPLLPNEFYLVEVISYFEDEAPRNVDRNITIFTPGKIRLLLPSSI